MSQARLFALFYLIYASLAASLALALMPPFQNADEVSHADRADQISHLHLLCQPLSPTQCGGRVDQGLDEAAKHFADVPFHRGTKVRRALYEPVAWGAPVPRPFSNTAIYPPFFYLPAACALMAARGLHLNVLHGLLVARLATALPSIALMALAIALAGDAAPLLFAILLLPMSFCLTAALSQDGPMLGTAALAASLLRRSAVAAPRQAGAWAAGLLALVAMARPPYAVLALLPLGVPGPWRRRLVAAASIIAATLGWAWLNLHRVHVPPMPDGAIDPMTQLLRVLLHPLQFCGALARTWQHWGGGLLGGFIGEPGWLDVDLPWWYQCTAWAMLALAAGIVLRTTRLGAPMTVLVAASILASGVALALLQYLTQSVVGASEIGGLQGRYFIVPALMIAACAPAREAAAQRPRRAAWPLLAFPAISIAVTMHAIVARYYY